MQHTTTRLLSCAVAALLLLGVAPRHLAMAQAGSTMPDPPIPCSAFGRDRGGGWTVLAPAMLELDGMLVSFTVGTSFAPGSTPHGLAMPVILDRECGNRAMHPLRP